jgi:hypothetical protein
VVTSEAAREEESDIVVVLPRADQFEPPGSPPPAAPRPDFTLVLIFIARSSWCARHVARRGPRV